MWPSQDIWTLTNQPKFPNLQLQNNFWLCKMHFLIHLKLMHKFQLQKKLANDSIFKQKNLPPCPPRMTPVAKVKQFLVSATLIHSVSVGWSRALTGISLICLCFPAKTIISCSSGMYSTWCTFLPSPIRQISSLSKSTQNSPSSVPTTYRAKQVKKKRKIVKSVLRHCIEIDKERKNNLPFGLYQWDRQIKHCCFW